MFVILADHALRLLARIIVEVLFELALDDAALFFDNQHFVLALYEVESAPWLQWPDHADLVYVDADTLGLARTYPQQPQRFHEIEMGFARRDDAEARPWHIEDLAVDRVGCGKGKRCSFLRFQAFLDLRSGEVRPAIVKPG